MLQKTFHIKNYTPEKMIPVLEEVASMTEYNTASQVLLLMMEQNWNTDRIREKIRLIGRVLPKAEIAGTTHFDGLVAEKAPDNTILTFFFFRDPAFTLKRFSLDHRTEEETGRELGHFIREHAFPGCLMTLFAGPPLDIGRILDCAEEGGGDVPVFGASAAFDTMIYSDSSRSFIFDDREVYGLALIAILFHGEDLHVRASFNYGWRQVGKIMTVSRLKDPYTVAEIDGAPAASIYEKYLGIPYRTNSLSIANICEFPLVSGERDPFDAEGFAREGMQMARIPYAWTPDGDLKFAVTMHEGEQIRLSYGLPQQIFSQIDDDADAFREFAPQGLLMVVCMNRVIFLRELEHRETDAYRSIVPDAAFVHGNSEIFRKNGTGGEMHSALIAVGFREGAASGPVSVPRCPETVSGDQAIPLELRLMTFMRAVTSDLEHATHELMQLRDHLEDEVEIKTRENESLSLHVVQTLAEAIDAKDSYTNGHSGRVAKYSMEIARRFGYSEKDQSEILMMGLLHDVGKIGVPDAVINKPGKLTDDEFEQIKNHPVMGARILKAIREMPRLVTGACWHHERYDGTGYPDGLKGEDIPEEARIIAVADAYDAMTSNRSYRRGMEQSAVREQIENGKGTQFDPRFADIMLGMIDEDREFRMREA